MKINYFIVIVLFSNFAVQADEEFSGINQEYLEITEEDDLSFLQDAYEELRNIDEKTNLLEQDIQQAINNFSKEND